MPRAATLRLVGAGGRAGRQNLLARAEDVVAEVIGRLPPNPIRPDPHERIAGKRVATGDQPVDSQQRDRSLF